MQESIESPEKRSPAWDRHAFLLLSSTVSGAWCKKHLGGPPLSYESTWARAIADSGKFLEELIIVGKNTHVSSSSMVSKSLEMLGS